MVNMNSEAVEFEIKRLQDCCEEYRKRIATLESGSCRFHCRVRRDIWKAGLVVGFTWDGEGTHEEQYTKWRNQNDGNK